MQDGKNAFDEAAASRTPGRDIFGPLDDHLPEIRIPADVRTDALRAAAKEGMDLTAWVRELVYGSLYGGEHIAMLHANRIRRVLGKAGQISPDQGSQQYEHFFRKGPVTE